MGQLKGQIIYIMQWYTMCGECVEGSGKCPACFIDLTYPSTITVTFEYTMEEKGPGNFYGVDVDDDYDEETEVELYECWICRRPQSELECCYVCDNGVCADCFDQLYKCPFCREEWL